MLSQTTTVYALPRQPPIIAAIQCNNLLAIQSLLQLGVAVTKDRVLHTALRVKHDNIALLSALCNAGADPHNYNEDGRIPLMAAELLYGPDEIKTRMILEATEK